MIKKNSDLLANLLEKKKTEHAVLRDYILTEPRDRKEKKKENGNRTTPEQHVGTRGNSARLVEKSTCDTGEHCSLVQLFRSFLEVLTL